MGDGLFEIFGGLKVKENKILKLGYKQTVLYDLTLIINKAFDKA
jgi:hypothetical protein